MKIISDRRGMTLVEVIIATSITAMIVGLLGTSLFMFTKVTGQGNAKLATFQDMQNAGQWITRDGISAQTTSLVEGAAPVASMTLNWSDGGQSNTVIYFLSGNLLKRSYNGTAMTVARNVSSVGFAISQGVITSDITSAPAGRWGVSKDATYKVCLRTI